jgi:hypothetical protein
MLPGNSSRWPYSHTSGMSRQLGGGRSTYGRLLPAKASTDSHLFVAFELPGHDPSRETPENDCEGVMCANSHTQYLRHRSMLWNSIIAEHRLRGSKTCGDFDV